MSSKPRKSTIKKLDRLAFRIEATQHELPSDCEVNSDINRVKSELMRIVSRLEQLASK